jgi:ABC-type branched-subunit amino acid transport system ATPase component
MGLFETQFHHGLCNLAQGLSARPAVLDTASRLQGRRQGLARVLLVARLCLHHGYLVLALADRAYVLERGSVVYEGQASALRENLDLRRSVLWM